MKSSRDSKPQGVSASKASAIGSEAFSDLERWLYSQSSSKKGLEEVEVEEEKRGREVLRMMMQAHIECRGDGNVGTVLTVSKAESNDPYNL